MKPQRLSIIAVSFLLTALLLSSFGTSQTITQASSRTTNINSTEALAAPAAAPPATAAPKYYLDRETAFVLKYALDYTYKGIYVAVNKDGALIPGLLPSPVWGWSANFVKGTDKSGIAQSTCIRYFLNEYQRVTSPTSGGTAGISAIYGSAVTPATMLGAAQNCADFVIAHLVVPVGVTLAKPNRVYYWSFSGREGIDRFNDDTLPGATNNASRGESVIPWAIAELALMLKNSGAAASVYQPYVDHANAYWQWRKNTATALPSYTDGSRNIEPGIGRDVFYSALSYTLAEVTGNALFRTGVGNNADGTPSGGIPFADYFLGTGNRPDFDRSDPIRGALQDGTYTAGFDRGVQFALEAQKLRPTDLSARDQYWDFGFDTVIDVGSKNLRTTADPLFGPGNLSQPFAHRGGRELTAGTLRSAWFFYTFGVDPNIFYYNAATQTQTAFRDQAVSFWNYNNLQFWDSTPGAEAYLEAVGQPYKPCFSGGTDVPMADWLAPTIGNKVHSLNSDRSALVTVSGVADGDWPYMNWNFKGSGVKKVEVVYTFNNGTTWNVLPATGSGSTYTATIPPAPSGTKVYYYARAQDYFNNNVAFPAGAETWADSGATLGQFISLSQSYTFDTPTPTTTPVTDTPTPTPTTVGTTVPGTTVPGTTVATTVPATTEVPTTVPGTTEVPTTEVPGTTETAGPGTTTPAAPGTTTVVPGTTEEIPPQGLPGLPNTGKGASQTGNDTTLWLSLGVVTLLWIAMIAALFWRVRAERRKPKASNRK